MKTCRNLFNVLEEKTPPAHLEGAISKRVSELASRQKKQRFVFSALLSLASFAGIVEAIIRLVQSATKSGFSQYLSLLFSDSSIFFSYWKEFGLSLLESLPLVSITLLLSVALVFLWSGARVLKNARGSFLPV